MLCTNGLNTSYKMISNRIELLFIVFILLWAENAGKITEPQNKVVRVGEDVILTCQCNEKTPIHWIKEEKILKHIITESYVNILNKNDSCSHELKIINVSTKSAGRYTCAKKLFKDSEHYVANVIVYGNNLFCATKNLYTNQIILQQAHVQWNDRIIINCSFTFHAHQSCRAIPLWIDNINNKTLSDSGSNIQFGAENKFIWLSFQGNTAFEDETSFNLSIAFNCSVSKTNLDEKHYADNIPIISTDFTSPKFLFLSISNSEKSFEQTYYTTQDFSGISKTEKKFERTFNTTKDFSAGTSNNEQKQTNLEIWAAIVPIYVTIMVLALVIYKRKRVRSTAATTGTVIETSDSLSNVEKYPPIKEGYTSPACYTELKSKGYAVIQSNTCFSSDYEEIQEENELNNDVMNKSADGSFFSAGADDTQVSEYEEIQEDNELMNDVMNKSADGSFFEASTGSAIETSDSLLYVEACQSINLGYSSPTYYLDLKLKEYASIQSGQRRELR